MRNKTPKRPLMTHKARNRLLMSLFINNYEKKVIYEPFDD